MNRTELIVRCVAGLALLAGNAFFVCIEFALTRLRQEDEERVLADDKLSLAWKMTEKLEIYLTGCQVGITIMSVGLGVVAEPAVSELFGLTGAGHGLAIALALTLINLLHVILGEQLPTYLGVERARAMCRYLAPIHYLWTKLMWPVIWLADGVTKGLLRLFGVEMSRSWVEGEEGEEEAAAGEIDRGSEGARSRARSAIIEAMVGAGVPPDRREEVVRSLDIDEIHARSIAIPLADVVSLSTAASTQENLDRIRDSFHDRYLLVGESLDDPRGVIHTPELLAHLEALSDGTFDFESVARPLLRVPGSLPVAALIDRFQKEAQELALVVGDEDAIVGLVTTTDALETIVGELEDPLDREGVRD